ASAGVIYGKRKAEWLHRRLFTERLRQFHFQTFVLNIREIAISCRGEAEQNKFLQLRDGWLQSFELDYKRNAETKLSQLLDPRSLAPMWVNAAAGHIPDTGIPAGFDATELFDAYRRLRFEEQEGYAQYMLRRTNSPLGLRKRRWRLNAYPGERSPLRRKGEV